MMASSPFHCVPSTPQIGHCPNHSPTQTVPDAYLLPSPVWTPNLEGTIACVPFTPVSYVANTTTIFFPPFNDSESCTPTLTSKQEEQRVPSTPVTRVGPKSKPRFNRKQLLLQRLSPQNQTHTLNCMQKLDLFCGDDFFL